MIKPRHIYKFDGKTPVFDTDLEPYLTIAVGIRAQTYIRSGMHVVISQLP